MTLSAPTVSIVIPVHNEEPILHAAIVDLRERLSDCDYSWELILAENGSTDGTVAVAQGLKQKMPNLSVFSTGTPNYGEALREGLKKARGQFVICEEIDLCDTDFHRQALTLLQDPAVDIVVGSKLLAGAHDERPLFRHAASWLYSTMLRFVVGFKGTDTHGLKALRRERILPILDACVVDRDVFASELLIRAERRGLRIIEIPVRVMEKRPPSINLIARVPRVLSNVHKLATALRHSP